MSDVTAAAKTALSLMDLTTLNDNDTDEIVISLCRQARSEAGNTAAICIYPRFIPVARKALTALGAPAIKIATVTNFPHGNDDIEIAVTETKAAIVYGADEVDLVFPYRALMNGNSEVGAQMVAACKAACGESILLKVIIESGELQDPALIKQASQICIKAGADFIKTSTGKVPVNATLESARIMLQAIKDLNPNVGFKAAGGVRNAEQAKEYIDLAKEILGPDWVSADHFRFGASSLLSSLLNTLGHGDQASESSGY